MAVAYLSGELPQGTIGVGWAALRELPPPAEPPPTLELLEVDTALSRLQAIAGPGSGEGWDFEPGARVGYTVNPKLDLSLEYYGSLGPVGEFFPTREQVHQIFPGFDWNIRENVIWNWGIGVGVTGSGNRLVYKWRIGYMFGKGAANP